jgi:hypothetical protein
VRHETTLLVSRLARGASSLDHHEMVTSLSQERDERGGMAASIAPAAMTRAIVAFKSVDRAFSATLRIAPIL